MKDPPTKAAAITRAIPSVDPLCAPEIPASTSTSLPGFFVWCLQGFVRVVNRGVLEPQRQWGVKTHLCEITSDGMAGDKGRTEYAVFHLVHDSTTIVNSPRSTRNLRTVSLVGTKRDVRVVPPGASIVYRPDGTPDEPQPGQSARGAAWGVPPKS